MNSLIKKYCNFKVFIFFINIVIISKFSYLFIQICQSQTQKRLDSPMDYIEYLKSDLNPKQIFRTLESLQVSLRSNKIQWLTEFAQYGLKGLLSILNECYRR